MDRRISGGPQPSSKVSTTCSRLARPSGPSCDVPVSRRAKPSLDSQPRAACCRWSPAGLLSSGSLLSTLCPTWTAGIELPTRGRLTSQSKMSRSLELQFEQISGRPRSSFSCWTGRADSGSLERRMSGPGCATGYSRSPRIMPGIEWCLTHGLRIWQRCQSRWIRSLGTLEQFQFIFLPPESDFEILHGGSEGVLSCFCGE